MPVREVDLPDRSAAVTFDTSVGFAQPKMALLVVTRDVLWSQKG